MLEARGLVKQYFGITAVNDVSFVVRPGEVMGYLGPNGSGKSTTARLVVGRLRGLPAALPESGLDVTTSLVLRRASSTTTWSPLTPTGTRCWRRSRPS